MLIKCNMLFFCKFFVILLIGLRNAGITAYKHLTPKESYAYENALLAEILNRMENNIISRDTYIDPGSDISNLALMPRTYNGGGVGGAVDVAGGPGIGDGDAFYEGYEGDTSYPSIRDQELLEHSSLWNHQFMSGGMGEGPNQMKTVIKTDASLPAYCNPPNPCPNGYTEDQGCISDFDNTAIFSREYQESQDCMCDGEHMFDCRGQGNDRNNKNDMMTTDIENFLMQQLQRSNENNFIAKKKHSSKVKLNPFLKGEQLPIAAKKGKRFNKESYFRLGRN